MRLSGAWHRPGREAIDVVRAKARSLMVMLPYMYARPSHNALTVQSTPACRSAIAVVWRRVIFLVCSVLHVNAAVAWCLANRCSTASRLKRLPVRVENNGSPGRCDRPSLRAGPMPWDGSRERRNP